MRHLHHIGSARRKNVLLYRNNRAQATPELFQRFTIYFSKLTKQKRFFFSGNRFEACTGKRKRDNQQILLNI
ncbi:hypothetical protein NG43_13515 [Winslowiella iniecta]|uniref:Uncharacterized protein n=1 Tax=Winslowiella iniecta TaxID=1560201 RepID=A0A0L7TAG6_9GAMM|nr:hypothetical protein NG43_13515 [Winslowiella iniecta]